MAQWKVETFKGVRRELRKRVPVSMAGVGTFMLQPDGYEEAEVLVSVDFEAIARLLGVKALGNSKGVSKYLDGLVIVSVRSRKRVAS